ncbi:MAG: hypothetical protein V3W34_06325 [Phycisphaerae bacterium]
MTHLQITVKRLPDSRVGSAMRTTNARLVGGYGVVVRTADPTFLNIIAAELDR